MYIRTKDGVYELVDNLYQYHNGVEKFWYAKEENGTTLAIEITANEILNQSENLVELCDEIVLINNNVFTVPQIITYTNFQNTKAYREDYGKFETIYGAIWTSKGLIYVAKMNEKGELVLI